jgi:uncharacterized membrane protein (UPF0127 family)
MVNQSLAQVSRRTALQSTFLHSALALLAATALFAAGCDEKPVDDKFAAIKISGKTFKLELSLDDEHRFKGLSNRTDLKPDGGMLFVFKDRDAKQQSFVMRDCPEPIDIIYLDRGARVVAFYTMLPEPPRTEAEKVLTAPSPGAPAWTHINVQYENRLKKYPSKHDSQFVIELKGKTIDTLTVKEGDKIELVGQTWDDLKKRAK